jgi:hypothetical protein
MGFTYYASFVRLVLTGAFSVLLMEKARALVKGTPARVGTED